MDPRDFLKQYETAENAAKQIRAEYEKELEQVDSIRSALGGDGLPRSGTVSKSVERQALRLAEKAEELKTAEIEALRIRQRVYSVVAQVPDEVGAVLYERYINLEKIEQIAETVNYSERHVYNLIQKGLDVVDQIINC